MLLEGLLLLKTLVAFSMDQQALHLKVLLFKIWKLAHLFPIEMSYELYVLDIIQVNKWRWNEL